MENLNEIVQQQAADALTRLNTQTVVNAETVAESVLNQRVYWETPLPSGERLMFVRLFSPVVQREEVFFGNILFNAFLHKAFARAIVEGKLGVAELVANDLESYYFLVRTQKDASQLADAFRVEVERSLPDLFFGEQDDARGIYGDLGRMFTFRKSDFEPFPVYAVPQFLAPQLEKAVRQELQKLLTPEVFPSRVRTVLATLAFFYGRTSGGSGDAQSFPNFVDHLVSNKDYDKLLKTSEVKHAFNIPAVSKPAIKQSIDDGTYAPERLRALLSDLSEAFCASIDGGSMKWLMGFLHKDEKFVSQPPSDYLNILMSDIQLGSYLFPRVSAGKVVPCRICNTIHASVEDRYVTTGLNSFKFDNQSIRRQAEKACVKCALQSYLAQKLLGTEMVSAGGKLPQVPKTHNLIFHYGKHDGAQVEELPRKIDLIWGRVTTHQQKERDVSSIRKDIRKLEDELARQKKEQKRQELDTQIKAKRGELKQKESELAEAKADLSWLTDANSTHDVPSLDILSNMFLRSKVEKHILGLGLGGYRMILFVMPQIRKPQDAKEHDFAQSRFSNSRVTVTAMLSFLREVCGCDGPFYYQSLPMLTPDAFERGTFYIRNQPISVTQAQDAYEVVTQLAWKLVRQWGSKGFVEKVVLAEKLLDDPLGTFSTVMRDSPILGVKRDAKKKRQPKRLLGDYRKDWQAQDLTEYARFIQKLSKLQEVK